MVNTIHDNHNQSKKKSGDMQTDCSLIFEPQWIDWEEVPDDPENPNELEPFTDD